MLLYPRKSCRGYRASNPPTTSRILDLCEVDDFTKTLLYTNVLNTTEFGRKTAGLREGKEVLMLKGGWA